MLVTYICQSNFENETFWVEDSVNLPVVQFEVQSFHWRII